MGRAQRDRTPGKAPSLQSIKRQTLSRIATRRKKGAEPAMAVLLQRDMLQEILKFLAPRELAACGAVCSTWLDVSQSAPLWMPHCEVLMALCLQGHAPLPM